MLRTSEYTGSTYSSVLFPKYLLEDAKGITFETDYIGPPKVCIWLSGTMISKTIIDQSNYMGKTPWSDFAKYFLH